MPRSKWYVKCMLWTDYGCCLCNGQFPVWTVWGRAAIQGMPGHSMRSCANAGARAGVSGAKGWPAAVEGPGTGGNGNNSRGGVGNRRLLHREACGPTETSWRDRRGGEGGLRISHQHPGLIVSSFGVDVSLLCEVCSFEKRLLLYSVLFYHWFMVSHVFTMRLIALPLSLFLFFSTSVSFSLLPLTLCRHWWMPGPLGLWAWQMLQLWRLLCLLMWWRLRT